MPGSQKLLYRNKKGELFPYDKSVNNNGLQFCCDRYNKALNECYEFIRLATSNPMSPIQQNLHGEYYTSPVYKKYFGSWCDYVTRNGKK